MQVTTYDMATGEVVARDMTPEELAELAAATATPPAVPQSVSLLQARVALILYGKQIGRPDLLKQVDDLVKGLPNGAPGMTTMQATVIREAWANAHVVRRDSPALNAIFPALGLTLPEQLDDLFAIAAGIVV